MNSFVQSRVSPVLQLKVWGNFQYLLHHYPTDKMPALVADEADLLKIALWLGRQTGVDMTLEEALRHGKTLHKYGVDGVLSS